jgi:hypothetical protein
MPLPRKPSPRVARESFRRGSIGFVQEGRQDASAPRGTITATQL